MTYGHGLPDCFIFPDKAGLNPSNLSWPSLIADALNRKCVNLSKSGGSNLFILNKILNFNFEPDDIVFVMWTYIGRDVILSKNSDGYFLPDMISSKELTKYWALTHNEMDLSQRSWIYRYLAQLHLTSKQVNFYFLTVAHEPLFNTLKPEYIKQSLSTELDFIGCSTQFPKSLDNGHPGVEAHENYAKTILNEFGLLA